MSIIFYIKLYVATLITFLGIDSIWLAKIAPNFYKTNIGHLLAEKPNLLAAGAFYILNIIGILFFCTLPALKAESPKTAIIYGALYGIFTYATYDLTNYATLKGWPVKVVIVDIFWGMLLTAVVAGVSYYIGSKL